MDSNVRQILLQDKLAKEVEDYLNQFVGCTMTRKLSVSCHKFMRDRKRVYRNFKPSMLETALVYTHWPNSNEILHISGSEPSDLIVNQWGEIFAAQWNEFSRNSNRSLANIDGVVASPAMKVVVGRNEGQTSNFTANNFPSPVAGVSGVAMRGQLGQDSSPKAGRPNFSLNNPIFQLFDMTNSGWSTLLGLLTNIGTTAPAPTNETIRETGYIGEWYAPGRELNFFLLYHDTLVGPGLSVGIGQLVTLEYVTVW